MFSLFAVLKSKITQFVAVAAFVLIVLAGAFRAGQKSARTDISERSLREVATKAQIDAQVSGMSAAARRDELRKWAN
ncbi:hypothetical protein [Rhizobium phage RHEph15]|nr:hypothetical protein [Rhizobium phage RHEph15]